MGRALIADMQSLFDALQLGNCDADPPSEEGSYNATNTTLKLVLRAVLCRGTVPNDTPSRTFPRAARALPRTTRASHRVTPAFSRSFRIEPA
jgi:hypothetical protein